MFKYEGINMWLKQLKSTRVTDGQLSVVDGDFRVMVYHVKFDGNVNRPVVDISMIGRW